MKHTQHVRSYSGPHERLAEDIGDLYYDALSEFLGMLAEKIERDAGKDHARGRVKLASELRGCAEALGGASRYIGAAWRICEPHAKAWADRQGEAGEPSD